MDLQDNYFLVRFSSENMLKEFRRNKLFEELAKNKGCKLEYVYAHPETEEILGRYGTYRPKSDETLCAKIFSDNKNNLARAKDLFEKGEKFARQMQARKSN